MKQSPTPSHEPLAIVGAACRFPGPASNLAEFWSLLADGKDGVTSLPPERFSLDRFFSASMAFPGHSYTTAAGIIPDLLEFDPDFFGISRTEALDLDPQQRLALEMTWEALEHAGIKPSSIKGSATGVYMGAAGTDAAMRMADDVASGSPYAMTGSTLSIVSNRISYYFDLHGPSLSVDTACSSSLVALHQACEALRAGTVPMAIVGGVNVLFAPYAFVGFSKARMLSPDGRCKVFDASGNGYVRSEGGGIVIVMPLSRALKDKHDILALVAGTGVNSDGRTTGIALPNPEAQKSLMRDVFERFALDPKHLVYMEAHGTGTAAGDPIEVAAIGASLGAALKGVRPLLTGSVKSTIGHLETASGMAGLIKALLVLRHGEVPPNLHLTTPNPAIDFQAANISVPVTRTPLPRAKAGDLVSVNSFGFGGTNAHVVLQRPAAVTRRKSVRQKDSDVQIPPLLLSARSPASLKRLAERCAETLDNAEASGMRDFASALAREKEQLELRLAVSASTPQAVRERLLEAARSEETGKTRIIREAIALESCQGSGLFAFSGNGSQWQGMGKRLLEGDAVFREAVEAVDAIIAPLQKWSIPDVLRNPDAHSEAFVLTEKSQPLIFAMQVGIVQSLRARGIQPAAVTGHSVGEVAAVWCAGALTLEDAALVIHVRSELQKDLRGTGSMGVANMPVERCREMLAEYGGDLDIAAENTPGSLSVAGKDEALKAFVAACKKQRIAAKILAIPYPFHTRFMDAIQEEMGDALSGIRPRKPRIPFFSSVLGGLAADLVPDAAYWRKNVRQPVLFTQAVKAAYDNGWRLFMEIGASPVLRSYIRDTMREAPDPVYVAAPLTKGGQETAELEAAWEKAWMHGWNLDLDAVFPRAYARQTLPAYAWNKEYCWRPDGPECRGYLNQTRVHPLLGWRLPLKTPVFENTIHLDDFPWLADHVAGSATPYPAAAFLESMLAAGRELFPESGIEVERVTLFRPLQLAQDSAKDLRLSVDPEDGGFSLEARTYDSAESWGAYARGRLIASQGERDEPTLNLHDPESFGLEVDKSTLYEMARRSLLHYGPAFQCVEKVWLKTDGERPELLAELSEPVPASAEGMLIPPPLLDGAFQTLFPLIGEYKATAGHCYLPAAFERLILNEPGVPRFSLARLEKISARSVVASFRLLDASGKTLLTLRNCRFRRAAWLEQEQTASKPYRLAGIVSPHRDAEPASCALSCADMAAVAKKRFEKSGRVSRQSVHPWLLLQYASLAAARETVLELPRGADDDTIVMDRLLATGGLLPSQEAWFRHMLLDLEKAGLAKYDNDSWEIRPWDKRQDATTLWRTLLAADSGYVSEATLLAHVYQMRRALLEGATTEQSVPALPVALPAALPAALIDGYFDNAASLETCASAARQCIRKLLETASPDNVVHILQVARRPLSFVSPLVPELEKAHCRYTVATSDENEAEAGAELYGHIPSMEFSALSLDDPDPEQTGRYSLIVLAWRLHEYLDLNQILANCRAMLAPGGMLLLVEQAPGPFVDYVFGSQPSWWEASLEQNQPVSLLQQSSFWVKSLKDALFQDVTALDHHYDSAVPASLLLCRNTIPGDDVTTDMPRPAAAQPHEETAPSRVADDGASDHPALSRHWLIAGRQAGTASALLASSVKDALEAGGETCSLMLADPSMPNGATAAPEFWTRLRACCGKGKTPHLIFLAGYDSQDDVPVAELEALQQQGLTGLASLAGVWNAFGGEARLYVLAGGAMTGMHDAAPVTSQGALLGFTRVMINELRASGIRFIDLHGPVDDALLASLIRELLKPDSEPEVMLTRTLRQAPRLIPLTPAVSDSKRSPAVTLGFDQPGRLGSLYWQAAPIQEPGEGQVLVNVKYAGLNFRDIMWSMGLLPDEALEKGFSGPGLGIECSGVVTAVGSGVTEWAPGDEVLCFGPSCLGSHVVTAASAVAAKPASISFAEAATIPVAFITAWYSLKHLARMRPGERVLIHGAAGGVGLAAVQIAAHMGLEVYATAGAAEKHHFLRQFGVTRLFSSRSTTFADEILKATRGEGVDCVLNSLAGEAATAGIRVLKPFGRFIELGKRDFFADTPMRLQPFSNNLSYFGVDVDQLQLHQPELARELFIELMDLFGKRKLIPLPHSVYAANRVVDAFQDMQQSRHIGKLVVSLDGAQALGRQAGLPKQKMELKPDAAYLVSGGNSGLGLAAALRLVRRGAKHILLLSRSGVKGEEDRHSLAALRANGVTVTEANADVTDAGTLAEVLRGHLETMPPLRGVIHAAAVLDDGMIQGLTPEKLHNALAAKTYGAWNLHTFTRDMELDFFVLFSSATSLFGNPGQAGYVAANGSLESLAAWRRSRGLPAQVIAWGAIGDTGMLTKNPKARQMLLQRLGVSPTASSEALDWLESCIVNDEPYSAFFGLNWQSRADLPLLATPRFSLLRHYQEDGNASGTNILEAVKAAASKAEAVRLIAGVLLQESAHILRMSQDKLQADTPLAAQGMDSLMAMELALAVEQKFELSGYALPLTDKTTVFTLAQSLHDVLTGGGVQSRAEEQQLEHLARQHGLNLSESQRDDVLETLSGDARD